MKKTYYCDDLSGFAFGGLPFPGTLRMASNDLIEYKASLEMGFSPAVCNLTLTADGSISSLSAISLTVKNSSPFISIAYIIGFFIRIITCSNNLLNKHIVEYKKTSENLTSSKIYLLILYLTSSKINYKD